MRYYLREEVKNVDQINHPTIRETVKFLNEQNSIEVVHYADLPNQSGLGSSSTFTVGFLNAMYSLQNFKPEKLRLAKEAIHIEQNLVRENVGSQDQCAAAFGGLRNYKFTNVNDIKTVKIDINEDKKKFARTKLTFIFTGVWQSASKTAEEQINNIKSKKIDLNEMSQAVDIGIDIITIGNNLNDFGLLLHEQWQIKKSLSSLITNSTIEDIYTMGIKAGAIGGKLLGAGAGGFILFYAEKEYHEKLKIL